jgi:nitronate monooxygenase
LALGAAGAAIGTRFCASQEALTRPAAKERLLRAKSGDTVRTSLFDQAVGVEWPNSFTGRALRNRFFEEWNGRSAALKSDEAAREAYRSAQQNGNYDTAVVWAGEGIDLISGIPSAGELVRKIGREAEQELRRLASLLR